jgi:hypothetical protein
VSEISIPVIFILDLPKEVILTVILWDSGLIRRSQLTTQSFCSSPVALVICESIIQVGQTETSAPLQSEQL